MSDFDSAAAWLALKASIVEGKRSRGQDELLATMARIEVDNQTPDGQRGFDDSPPLSMTRTTTAHAA